MYEVLARSDERPFKKSVNQSGSRSPLRLVFFHGMDTYAEFQVRSMSHQGWISKRYEWVTLSAPNRGADFSSGAGGLFLRERFGYEPHKS